MSNEPLVQVTGLHKRYGAVHAVRGLDLSLQRGQILGLLGANGAGKSTTMAMLAGVLAATDGTIQIGGDDLARQPLAAKARLGYLPETPPLYDELTVDEFLRHCAALRGLPRKRIGAAVASSKSRCALTDSGSRLLSNLSKGYRQRVGIAQAIVHDPELVILDEPTSGLDPAQLRDIRLLIRELGERHAVVFSTHLLSEAQQVCDQVHIIHQGRLALSAPMDALPGAQDEYRVRLIDRDDNDVSVDTLKTLSMVDEAYAAHETTVVRLAAEDNTSQAAYPNPRRALKAFSLTCAERGWLVLELTPHRQSLEDLFMATAYAPAEHDAAAQSATPGNNA